jgi:hypothetical protein
MLHCVAMVRMGLPSVSIVAHAAPSPRPSSRATPHPGAPLPQQPATDAAACPRQPSSPCSEAALRQPSALRSKAAPRCAHCATVDLSASPGAPLPQQPATDSAAEILPASSRGMLRNSPAEHGSKRLSCPACAASHRALMRQPSTSCIQAALSRPLPGGSRSGCFVPPAPLRVWPCMCVSLRSWIQREPLPPRRPAIRCACAAAASAVRAISVVDRICARRTGAMRAKGCSPAALPALGQLPLVVGVATVILLSGDIQPAASAPRLPASACVFGGCRL